MSPFSYIVRGIAALEGLFMVYVLIKQLRQPNGSRVAKWAMLFLNLLSLGGLTLANLYLSEILSLGQVIDAQSVMWACLNAQPLIIYLNNVFDCGGGNAE